jgi:RNA polymerase sigma-70 factor (ECF subfamily)
VNSALQRARATLADTNVDPFTVSSATADQQALLARYVDAFERYDVSTLVTLLHDDVVQSMPPYMHWLVGPDEVGRWMLGPGQGCEGSRLLATVGNGCPAFGQYRVDPAGGHAPWSLVVIEMSGDRIVGLNNFLDTALFEYFGLPAHL